MHSTPARLTECPQSCYVILRKKDEEVSLSYLKHNHPWGHDVWEEFIAMCFLGQPLCSLQIWWSTSWELYIKHTSWSFPHRSHCKTKRNREQAGVKTPYTLEQWIRIHLTRIKITINPQGSTAVCVKVDWYSVPFTSLWLNTISVKILQKENVGIINIALTWNETGQSYTIMYIQWFILISPLG